MQSNNQIVSAIIIAGIIIAGAVLLKDTKAPNAIIPSNSPGNLPAPSARPVTSSDHIIGNINAKIVIVEYSDLECPYCKVFHQTMHKVVSDNSGNVAWVFRHYPIPQLHPKAFREAEATECAWGQGGNNAFWKYTDRLFEVTPSNNRLEDSELTNIASYVGLNLPSFNDCLSSGKYKEKVQADVEDGLKAGLNQQGRGTPFSLILKKGEIVDTIPGAEPYEMVKQKIDSLLK